METPIFRFLSEYCTGEIARLHMPGHKGNAPDWPVDLLSCFDITEIKGADALYEAEGIIGASEENAASLYGTKFTCYSAGGSTLGIQTMLAAVCNPGDRILAARNAHTAFVNTCILLDVTPVWLLPEYNDSFGISGAIAPETVEASLRSDPDVKAVYLTSPDYLGCRSDIRAIAAICKSYGKPLLVDNAHGAHLRFLPEDCHPITLGASLCCDSAHKTLPVLTGGGYLHVSRDFPADKAEIKSKMALFGSTSPSYLILLSLDLCNRYLAERGRDDFSRLASVLDELYALAAKKGFCPLSERMDGTKLTLDGYAVGMTGEELAEHFRHHAVECEYAAKRHMVLMLSPQNSERDIERVKEALDAIVPRTSIQENEAPFALPKRMLSPRVAAFAPQEKIPAETARGRIAGETRIKCPPGIPILVAGEQISEITQKLLKKSRIETVNVVK